MKNNPILETICPAGSSIWQGIVFVIFRQGDISMVG
jgi:hypothetical protein